MASEPAGGSLGCRNWPEAIPPGAAILPDFAVGNPRWVGGWWEYVSVYMRSSC